MNKQVHRRGGLFVLNKNKSAQFLTALLVTTAFTVPAFAEVEVVVVIAPSSLD
jgi:hypothetical protein